MGATGPMLLFNNNFLLLLFLHLLTVEGILYTVPQKVAKLFMQEEKILSMLMIVNNTSKSERLSMYLDSCQPRIEELALLDTVDEDSEKTRLVDIMDLLVGNPVHVYILMDRLVNL